MVVLADKKKKRKKKFLSRPWHENNNVNNGSWPEPAWRWSAPCGRRLKREKKASTGRGGRMFSRLFASEFENPHNKNESAECRPAAWDKITLLERGETYCLHASWAGSKSTLQNKWWDQMCSRSSLVADVLSDFDWFLCVTVCHSQPGRIKQMV